MEFGSASSAQFESGNSVVEVFDMNVPEQTDRRPRVIVLGLDGATFTLLRPWAEAGYLPNLARLMDRGAWGSLASTTPPYSAPAWVSFITGKGPGKHGIVDFWRYPPRNGRKAPIHSGCIGTTTLWDIVGREGRAVGVVNMPVTYPPVPMNGVMISGLMTPGRVDTITYPPTLRAELEQVVGQYLADPYTKAGRTRAFLEQALHWIHQHERANRHLLTTREFGLFINVIQAPDAIQHHFWRHLDSSHPYYNPHEAMKYQDLSLQCYQAIDEVIGHRLDMLDRRTTLFVLSDHGFGSVDRAFNVNRFLVERGYLVFGSTGPHPVRVRVMASLRRVLRRGDFLDLRSHLLSRYWRNALRSRLDAMAVPPIDWMKTRAYYTGITGEGIYINLRGREESGVVSPGAEYEAVRDCLIAELQDLRDPDTAQAVLCGVYRREEVYEGPFMEQMPDIVLSLGDSRYLPDERFATTRVIEPLPPYTGGGRHYPEGMFLAVGRGVRSGARLTGARIVDIAPTILYALGLGIPEDMDGRVLLQIFSDEHLASWPIRSVPPVEGSSTEQVQLSYSDEELGELEERLRALGYME